MMLPGVPCGTRGLRKAGKLNTGSRGACSWEACPAAACLRAILAKREQRPRPPHPHPPVPTVFGTEWHVSVWYCEVKVSVVHSKNSQGSMCSSPQPVHSAQSHDVWRSAGSGTNHQTVLLPKQLWHTFAADVRH